MRDKSRYDELDENETIFKTPHGQGAVTHARYTDVVSDHVTWADKAQSNARGLSRENSNGLRQR